MVSFGPTGLIVALVRNYPGSRPAWLTGYEDDAKSFCFACALMIFAFKCTELCGNWEDGFGMAKWMKAMAVLLFLQIATAKLTWLVAVQISCWFIVGGNVFDRTFQDRVGKELGIQPIHILPSSLRGHWSRTLPVNEETTQGKKRDNKHEQGDEQIRVAGPTFHRPEEV
jgi:hypothetical protein